jgi:single-stranded-DNA-specific exonuclease
MGNPPAKLLIKNCWFKNIRQNNSQDFRGKKVAYIKTTFELWDNSVEEGFRGMWWGHYQEDLPPEKLCDAVVELDYNNYTKDCEARLIAVKEIQEQNIVESGLSARDYLLDWRDKKDDKLPASSLMLLEKNPQSWAELYRVYCQAIAKQEKLTLSYHKSPLLSNIETWKQLLGIAKYLARTKTIVTESHLKEKLDLSDNTLTLGLMALSEQGFSHYIIEPQQIRLNFNNLPAPNSHPFLTAFLDGLAEERFKCQYFEQVPLDIIQEVLIDLKVL